MLNRIITAFDCISSFDNANHRKTNYRTSSSNSPPELPTHKLDPAHPTLSGYGKDDISP